MYVSNLLHKLLPLNFIDFFYFQSKTAQNLAHSFSRISVSTNIVFAFDSVMCRIYNVNLKLLPTVYHYTEQTDIRNNIVRRRHQF